MSRNTEQSGVVWIGSYPKSGNTWLRFILAYLLLEKRSVSSADVDAFIPEAMIAPGYQITIPCDQPVLLKTHWKMSMSLPLMKDTLGFIYIARNPMDIMCSQFNFNRLRLNKDNRMLSAQELSQQKRKYVEFFIQYKGNPLIGDGGGNTSWVQNVLDWVQASESYPSVIIRYEDLLNDPEHEIHRIMQFIGLKPDKQKINAIIKKTSFKSMRRLEESEIKTQQEGFFYSKDLAQAHQSGNRFMRKGKKGEGRFFLEKEQLSRFIDTFGETMELLNYRINPKTGAVRIDDFRLSTVRELGPLPAFGYARVSRL